MASALIGSESGHFTQCRGPVQRAVGDQKTNSSSSPQSLNSLVISASAEHILQLLQKQVGDDKLPHVAMLLSQVLVPKPCFCFRGTLVTFQCPEVQVVVMGSLVCLFWWKCHLANLYIGENLSPFIQQMFLSICYMPSAIPVTGNRMMHEIL